MISYYLGIDSDYVIIGLAVITLLLIILTIINVVQTNKLKKSYKAFMTGRSGKNLEDNLIKRLDQIDELINSNKENEKNISRIFQTMKSTYQKMGLIKYDAFNEMGGKLSFSLAMLDEKNNGFIINAMHTREGCYTYIKEIIDGNSIIVLSEEEQKALDRATGKTKAN
jgi:ABC-type transport system involved in multi-copper enzyme maturation permease subunit